VFNDVEDLERPTGTRRFRQSKQAPRCRIKAAFAFALGESLLLFRGSLTCLPSKVVRTAADEGLSLPKETTDSPAPYVDPEVERALVDGCEAAEGERSGTPRKGPADEDSRSARPSSNRYRP